MLLSQLRPLRWVSIKSQQRVKITRIKILSKKSENKITSEPKNEKVEKVREKKPPILKKTLFILNI